MTNETTPMRTCSRCKLHKPLTAQYFHKRLDGFQTYCKECRCAVSSSADKEARKTKRLFKRTDEVSGQLAKLRAKQRELTHRKCPLCKGVQDEPIKGSYCLLCTKQYNRARTLVKHIPNIDQLVAERESDRMDYSRENARRLQYIRDQIRELGMPLPAGVYDWRGYDRFGIDRDGNVNPNPFKT